MSFLDTLKSTAKNLGDKAADTAEIAKLKMKISSAESDIKGIYTEMGKKLFEDHPEYLEKFFTEEKGKIEELTANIAALKERIEVVKTTVGKVEDVAEDAADVLLLLGREPFLAVAIQIVGAVTSKIAGYTVAHLNKHVGGARVILHYKSCSKCYLLVLTIESALPVLDGVGVNSPSVLLISGHFECRLEAQAMIVHWTLRVKAIKPAWSYLA